MLSPENVLHIGVGSITGLVNTKVSSAFLSSLTGWVGEASISGVMGDELMSTGYILVQGWANKPLEVVG